MAKAPTDIRSLARSHGPSAINVLKGIMENAEAPPPARVAAAAALLDRGFGKPHQTSEVTVTNIKAAEIPDNELASIATGSGEGITQTPLDPSQLN